MKIVKLGVIVPSRDRPQELNELLDSLKKAIRVAGATAIPVVVVDDGSHAPIVLEERIDISILRLEGEGPSAARNKGVKLIQDSVDYFMFIDDDCVVDETFFVNLFDLLRTTNGSKVFIPNIMDIKNGRTDIIAEYLECLNYQKPTLDKNNLYIERFPSACFIIAKESFEQVEGFPEDINWPGGEDDILSIKLKQKNVLISNASNLNVKHRHPETFRDLLNRWFNYGKGHAIVCELTHIGRVDYGLPKKVEQVEVVGWVSSFLKSCRNIFVRRNIFRNLVGLTLPITVVLAIVLEIARQEGARKQGIKIRREGLSSNW